MNDIILSRMMFHKKEDIENIENHGDLISKKRERERQIYMAHSS
jgi:hypothetical protein